MKLLTEKQIAKIREEERDRINEREWIQARFREMDDRIERLERDVYRLTELSCKTEVKCNGSEPVQLRS
jgi:hypothetical protein